VSELIDQLERTRFVEGHEINISVIAPAGVGKTTAIVNRIVHLARLPEAQAVERLSRLVVVTYSVRAAQQMQQRARMAIRDANVSTTAQRAFQQTFFGTIHSFCVRLLERFGHFLGLPSPVGLLQDETETWRRFLLRGLDPEMGNDPHLSELFHFYSPEQLYGLGRILPPGDEIVTSPLPELEVNRLLNFKCDGLKGPTKSSIQRAQERTLVWNEAWKRGQKFRPLPSYPPSPLAASYAEVWRETFSPLYAWLHDNARAFGRRIANAYERFRLAEAVMTYDDQVRLALRVLDDPVVQRELAADGYSVLLDEAQDTDPNQFEVLRRVAGLGGDLEQPDAQNFSIVGDFQQAIYAPRSDLATYQAVHDEIRKGSRGATSQLKVTFRCDKAIIDFVNRIFPPILNNSGGQASFVPLVSRAGAGPGQVVRLVCPELPDRDDAVKVKSALFYDHEARFIAKRIHELGFAGLGVRSWSQVVILCPRKNWLLDLRHALVEEGLRVQLHSSDETPRDRMPGTWLTALIWIAAHPEDVFEIAGVLREVLGVSDNDIALFTESKGDRLRLDRPFGGEGTVARALDQLRNAIAKADEMPLHDAIGQIVGKTQLRERLCSIPDADREDVNRELDEFLSVIAARSAEGVRLADLAHELRTGLTLPASVEEEIHEDAIQMMTSHKSKGLEWDALIVPYLFRRIEWKSPTYPRVVALGVDDVIICRDKAEYEDRARNFVTLRERQQVQRLYYVMFTRARRTLVLFDDELLMAGIKERVGEIAGEFLQFSSGPNRETFHALPNSFSLVPELDLVTRVVKSEIEALPTISSSDIKTGIEHAQAFPRRTTPHALARHTRKVDADAEPEEESEVEDDQAVADEPGLLYGTWWHEFVETIPWHQPQAIWQKKFTEAQGSSPQPERSEREWELFRKSELARWLGEPGRIIQAEIPFLWGESEQTCLEGIIDLAVFSESDAVWRVIDWKTNRIGALGSSELVEIYRPQIEAYVRVLREMLSTEVRGSLYLTQSGEWIDIE
jgi:ATP-dependent exoDNAse (exonuclease V) beta subunit